MAILVLVSKKALANCSPSVRCRKRMSMMACALRHVHTSEGTLDNLEVGDIAEEVGRTGRIRVSPLLLLGGAVSVAVHAVRLRRGLVAGAVREVDLDHLSGIVGCRVTVGVGAHFERIKV